LDWDFGIVPGTLFNTNDKAKSDTLLVKFYNELGAFSIYATGAAGDFQLGLDYFDTRFPKPATGDQLTYYSTNHGHMHLVQMSNREPWGVGSDQYNFIEQDLEVANRSRAFQPYIVFTGYTAMYSQCMGPNEADLTLRATYEPLFLKYGVDVAIWYVCCALLLFHKIH
jgi:hypothetical protein